MSLFQKWRHQQGENFPHAEFPAFSRPLYASAIDTVLNGENRRIEAICLLRTASAPPYSPVYLQDALVYKTQKYYTT